ncbi:MAG: DUF4238 domain-containing protein [Oscillospiraceae bacterium]|nr:DUF4238 domain-containing protein [Oscillospiraceae bacterium]
MAQATKKQHYVPQFYLNAWGGAKKHQIIVYDKELDLKRINSIKDVASERFFYDISPKEIFSDKFIDCLCKKGLVLNKNEVPQLIERAYSEEVEAPFSVLLKKILISARDASPWHIKNCFFIKEDDKELFSAFLALQYIRLKHVRTGIQATANTVMEFATTLGASLSEITKYSVTDEIAKKTHIQMMLDAKNLSMLTACFFRLVWILGINRTKQKFFTSDNPIVSWAHIYNSIYSMNGLASKGVEVFFPLSPDAILIMFDGSYHKQALPHERNYIEISDNALINRYNSLIAFHADRFVFSSEWDMSLLESTK